MAPAFLANMAPPFVKYWKGWNRPISARWLGSHKTVMGFVLGIGVAVIATLAQSLIHWRGGLLSYSWWPLLGLRFGVGAMAGDSIKSAFKRRLGIAPGRPWIPADQLDYVLGALAMVWNEVRLSTVDLTLILGLSLAGHFAVSRIGFWMGVRDVKF